MMLRLQWLNLVSVFLVVVLSGCAQKYYQPQVFMDGKLNRGYVTDAAVSSADAFEFISKIYIKHNRNGDKDVIKEKVVVPNGYFNVTILRDVSIFETYCKSKMGQLYMLSSVPGVSYYICEASNKTESVLGCYNKEHSNTYEVYLLQVMSPNFFIKNLKTNHKEYYYSNEDKNISLASSPSPDYSNDYQLFFFKNYKNTGSSPMHLDLDNSKIYIDGKEYRVAVKRNWLLNAKLKENNTSIITLNPGETFEPNSQELILTIKGLKEFISENVILSFGETKFNLNKRMTYEDKIPFATQH